MHYATPLFYCFCKTYTTIYSTTKYYYYLHFTNLLAIITPDTEAIIRPIVNPPPVPIEYKLLSDVSKFLSP